MPIIHIASTKQEAEAQGVNVKDISQKNSDGTTIEMWTYETHIGLCLKDREMNGYNDSDFYMTVWNPEKQEPEELLFATTRGWSYPCMASKVDATPEVRQAYADYQSKKKKSLEEELSIYTQADPTVGKTVVVIDGRKHKGEKGVVFWRGVNKFRNTRYMTPLQSSMASLLAHNQVIGVKTDSGKTFFVKATYVKVEGQSISSEEAINTGGAVRWALSSFNK